MSDAPRPGLRERKRVATRRAIQLAVLRLVTERGLDNVTIDDISNAADVSPRTFFNYFASKEAAIVGDGLEFRDEAAILKFVGAGPASDVLGDLATLMATAATEAAVDMDSLKLRQEIHKKYPQMSNLLVSGRRQFENQLVTLVSERLLADDPTRSKDEAALESRARLIAFVGVGALRHAWISWANGTSGQPLDERIHQSFRELDSLLVSRQVDFVG